MDIIKQLNDFGKLTKGDKELLSEIEIWKTNAKNEINIFEGNLKDLSDENAILQESNNKLKLSKEALELAMKSLEEGTREEANTIIANAQIKAISFIEDATNKNTKALEKMEEAAMIIKNAEDKKSEADKLLKDVTWKQIAVDNKLVELFEREERIVSKEEKITIQMRDSAAYEKQLTDISTIQSNVRKALEEKAGELAETAEALENEEKSLMGLKKNLELISLSIAEGDIILKQEQADLRKRKEEIEKKEIELAEREKTITDKENSATSMMQQAEIEIAKTTQQREDFTNKHILAWQSEKKQKEQQ